MPMKNAFLTIMLVAHLTAGVAVAQLANAAATVKAQESEGDRAWSAVEALRSSTRPTPAPATPTSPSNTTAGNNTPTASTPATTTAASASNQSRTQQQATASRATAQAAKDFYSRYPTHPQAAPARKLEALSAVDGIAAGDSAYEQQAIKVANDYRVDRKNPAADRFQVAHTVERYQVSKKLGGKHYLTSPVEAEKMADRLRKELGELHEVHALYLTIARSTNCENGGDVARKLLQLPVSPSIKTAARQIIERRALLGKPLEFSLTTAEGKTTKLSEFTGGRTVVCFWDGKNHPAGPPGLHEQRRLATPDTTWVYVSVGALAPMAKGTAKTARPAGTTCVEPLGVRSPLLAQLKITQLPCVYVLDARKNLSGIGRIDELPVLLSRQRRLIEP